MSERGHGNELQCCVTVRLFFPVCARGKSWHVEITKLQKIMDSRGHIALFLFFRDCARECYVLLKSLCAHGSNSYTIMLRYEFFECARDKSFIT